MAHNMKIVVELLFVCVVNCKFKSHFLNRRRDEQKEWKQATKKKKRITTQNCMSDIIIQMQDKNI